ncbi:fungal-specific transcription factor domain-containing protein [Aspergillus unguis]
MCQSSEFLQQPKSDSATPKKRYKRSLIACDWCHVYHVRCNRTLPCSRCLRNGRKCEFTRARRKRGRPPMRDPFEAGKGADASGERNGSSMGGYSTASSVASSVQTPKDPPQSLEFTFGLNVGSPSTEDLLSLDAVTWPGQGKEPNVFDELLLAEDLRPLYNEPSESDIYPSNGFNFTDSECKTFQLSPRYPILQPLMPYINTRLSPDIAYDLLDLYFTSAFQTHMHPVCKNVHCWVLRKASLVSESYRPTSLALLASMLWVASSEDHILSPLTGDGRRDICQFLGELTINLLKASNKPYLSPGDMGPPEFELDKGIHNGSCRAASLDDLITYIHIASVITANEQRDLGMHWWNMAFTLARKLNLGRELEASPNIGVEDVCLSSTGTDNSIPSRMPLNCLCYRTEDSILQVTEEQREERRRVWWLLFMMDRHLAFCYNRLPILQDSECEGLLLPLDEESWQVGEIHSNSFDFQGPQCILSGFKATRRKFPDGACRDFSIFGFFLPFTSILGQVSQFTRISRSMSDSFAFNQNAFPDVLHQLELYEASIDAIASAVETGASTSSIIQSAETQMQWVAQTMKAYASYYVDVLRLLLNCKEHPVPLEEELSTSSSTLTLAIPHALKVAESLKKILKFDSDVSFMPVLFSSYLQQTGFYFLRILEHLRDQADEPFLKACEVIVRTFESCFNTLNTGYLREFCQILRSALTQARGRPVHVGETQRRIRASLVLYRQIYT